MASETIENKNDFKPFNSRRDYLPYLLMLAVIIGAIFVLFYQGRIWWCKWDTPVQLWSSDAWGTHNSQHLFDPYSFTHILHGLGFYGILYLIFRRKISLAWLLLIAVSTESAWEVLENSKSVIERYRAATISLEYFGDSIANSFGDIVCCATGFLIAHKLAFVSADACRYHRCDFCSFLSRQNLVVQMGHARSTVVKRRLGHA